MTHQLFHLGVKAAIIDESGKILILQKNPKNLKFPDIAFWDFPGGRLEEGYTIEGTIFKEIKEETGLKRDDVKMLNLLGSTVAVNKNPTDIKNVNLILFVYEFKIRHKKDIRLNFEHINYKWASIREAKNLLSHKYGKDFLKLLDKL